MLILGASARAAAFCALRAGLQPWCADLFADVDLRGRCPVQRLSVDDYPHGFVEIVRQAPPGPWMYAGGLENRPSLVSRLSGLRPLWGNGADVLARVRSPVALQQTLNAAKLPCPAVSLTPPARNDPRCWLLKPRDGAGGIGIRFWQGSTPNRSKRPLYFQEFIEGEAAAAVFVGNGNQARFLGSTQQLVGETWLHAFPFRYCGSIGPLPVEPDLRERLDRLGNVLTAAFGLRGLFGVDCAVRDGVPWPVEVNPRYTASVEVLEYATGFATLALHRAIFDPGAESAWHPGPTSSVVGKAILFAQTDLTFPADGPWLSVLKTPAPVHELPAFADVPQAGQRIEAGHPILTFFARGDSPQACLDALHQIAADLDRRLFAR